MLLVVGILGVSPSVVSGWLIGGESECCCWMIDQG